MRKLPTPRKLGRLLMLVAAVTLAAAACTPAPPDPVRDLVNQSRRSVGLPALIAHGQLDAKAQAWSEKLARDGRLSHSHLPSGITVQWKRLGENVGMGPTIESVHRAYLNSPSHRANILNSSFNHIGTGHTKVGSTVYTVHVFAQL
jgi:uncharacterized protein YkwD